MTIFDDLPESLRLLAVAASQTPDCTFELVDDASKFLAKVTIAGKHFYPSAAKIPVYPLNSSNSAELVTDKAYTNLLIDRLGIDRTSSSYFYIRENSEKYGLPGVKEAKQFCEKIGYPVFCKPNRGSHGNLADVCFDKDQLEILAHRISQEDHIFHVQKFYRSAEFRIYCLDGEIVFGYERQAPCVQGNGVSTVLGHINEINSAVDFDSQKIDPQNNYLNAQLNHNQLTLDDVLPNTLTLQLSAAANIARGGDISEIVRDSFSEKLMTLAVLVHQEFNLRVCAVDFFADSMDSNEVTVIEINHNPSLKGIAKIDEGFAIAVWQKILTKYADAK